MMRKFLSLSCVLGVFVVGVPAAHADLAGLLESDADIPHVPANGRRNLVMVDGVNGDTAKAAFNSIQALWEAEGYGSAEIIRPATSMDSETNSKLLIEQVRALMAAAPKRSFILMGHSRGAYELLLGLLRDPSLIGNARVERVVFVDGAFYGTPLADWLEGFVDPISNAALAALRPALKSLKTAVATLNTESGIAALKSGELASFRKKSRYLRSRQQLFFVRPAFLPSQAYLQFCCGDNDGMVMTDRQSVDSLGIDWGVLTADHMDWVEPGDRANRLIRGVLHQIATE